MKKQDISHKTGKGLTYRLRGQVILMQEAGVPHLLLPFPLKVLIGHPRWMPVFEHLRNGMTLSLENILSMMDPHQPERIGAFLEDLVCKGFLEREGLEEWVHNPFISVIIPVRNRPVEIAACIESLKGLDYPAGRLEIIVVDDASTDDTADVIRRYPVRLIGLKEHKQASYCRNLAARESKGEILAFIDSDCLASPLWLRELIPSFEDDRVGVVGGLVDACFEESNLDRYEKVKSSLKVGQWFKRSDEGDRFFYVPSCNLLTRRSLFLELGGFKEDQAVGEDVDYCWRVQDQGYFLEYRPIGRIYHRHRNRLAPFCKRRFDYGTSEPLLQANHRERAKQFMLPLPESLFWASAVSSVAVKSLPLFAVSLLVLLFDALNRYRALRRKGISLTFKVFFMASFRGYLAFLVHVCSFFSRYYLLWAILLSPLFPMVFLVMMGMHLLAGTVEFRVKRPRLSLSKFLMYFTFEQISYQCGVWWGCLRRIHFGPVNPRIVGRRTLKRT